MPSVPAVFLTIALSAVMALAAQTNVLLPVVATVFVAQVLIATAPSPADDRGRAVPTPQLVPTLMTGVVAAVIAYHPLFLLGAGTRAGIDGLATSVFAGLLVGVATGVLAAIVGQVMRRDARRNLVRSLAAVVSLCLFAGMATAWIGAARAVTGRDVVSMACAGIAAGLLIWIVPASRSIVVPVALAVAGASAVAVARLIDSPTPWRLIAPIGVAAAGFAFVGLVVGRAWGGGRHHLAVGWALPGALAFALTGPLVFIACDLVTVAL